MRRTKLMDSFIEVLYLNGNIRHKEIAQELRISPSSLSNCIQRYLTIEPPLFYKTKDGKQSYYCLTKEGEEYGQQIIEKDLEDRNPNCITPELTETLITFILEQTPESQNTMIQCLKRIDISTISQTFGFYEFMFLALSLEYDW